MTNYKKVVTAISRAMAGKNDTPQLQSIAIYTTNKAQLDKTKRFTLAFSDLLFVASDRYVVAAHGRDLDAAKGTPRDYAGELLAVVPASSVKQLLHDIPAGATSKPLMTFHPETNCVSVSGGIEIPVMEDPHYLNVMQVFPEKVPTTGLDYFDLSGRVFKTIATMVTAQGAGTVRLQGYNPKRPYTVGSVGEVQLVVAGLRRKDV